MLSFLLLELALGLLADVPGVIGVRLAWVEQVVTGISIGMQFSDGLALADVCQV